MSNFTLFWYGDVVFIAVLTITYFLYSYIKKEKTEPYIRFCLVFLSAYFLIFYLLTLKYSLYDVKGIFGLLFLPVLTISYMLVLFKKNRKIGKYLIILCIAYLLFFATIIMGHYFSDM